MGQFMFGDDRSQEIRHRDINRKSQGVLRKENESVVRQYKLILQHMSETREAISYLEEEISDLTVGLWQYHEELSAVMIELEELGIDVDEIN